MSTQKYHHGDLKAQLIRQGLKLLDAEGYDGFSLRKAAKACGVSQTAPYRHFKSKDDLISAITNHALDAFGRRLQAAVELHPGEPMAQLTEMGVAYVRFFAENPETLRLLFLSDIRLRRRFAAGASQHRHVNAFGVLQDTITGLKETYPELPFSQDELILYSWGMVHGISTLIAADELPNNEETLARAENVIRGIFEIKQTGLRRD
ncbi:MAG: TetR/AcrR family transcriptional regulator [Clostridiales bacterium]|nr:TetR/AcrR family transcriptional regulator [Clostridiales bacterium]